MADVRVRQAVEDTVMFKLLTPQATEWVNENVIEDHERAGDLLLVDPRYADEIRYGMEEDGLEVD